MANYTIQGPDGSTYDIQAPDNATDEQVMSYFKQNYKSAPSGQPASNTFSDIAKQAVQTALPSPEALNPIQPSGSNPIVGGAEAALQTLRDPTRISPTISQPGQIASESAPSQAAQQQIEKTTGIPQPVSKFVEQAILDPQTYLGMEAGELPKGIQKQLSSLGEVLTGVDKESFMKLANDPSAVLGAQPSSVTGKAFQAAKEAAGVTEADDRVLATNDFARKRLYRQVMSKIDDMQPMKPGDQINVAGDGKTLPDQSLVHNGPTVTDTPENLKQMGLSDEAINEMKQPTYTLSSDIPGHPAGSTITQSTLEGAGYKLPARGDDVNISVADLLKAKKAGQLIANSTPEAAGQIAKDITQKVNPLLKQMAPDVYDAQQAVHMSKVKEAFQQVFPQGKGMYKYIRTLGMLGGSIFHGIGALESPAIAGAATLAGNTAAKIALSPASMFNAGKALQGFRMMNTPDMQSLRDRLQNNAQ